MLEGHAAFPSLGDQDRAQHCIGSTFIRTVLAEAEVLKSHYNFLDYKLAAMGLWQIYNP